MECARQQRCGKPSKGAPARPKDARGSWHARKGVTEGVRLCRRDPLAERSSRRQRRQGNGAQRQGTPLPSAPAVLPAFSAPASVVASQPAAERSPPATRNPIVLRTTGTAYCAFPPTLAQTAKNDFPIEYNPPKPAVHSRETAFHSFFTANRAFCATINAA